MNSEEEQQQLQEDIRQIKETLNAYGENLKENKNKLEENSKSLQKINYFLTEDEWGRPGVEPRLKKLEKFAKNTKYKVWAGLGGLAGVVVFVLRWLWDNIH